MDISKTFLHESYNQEDLCKLLQNLFKNVELSESSKNQYSTKISQWVSYLPTEKTLYNLIHNPEQSLKILETTGKIKHSPSNHHCYLSATCAFIKFILDDYPLLKEWKVLERKNSEPLVAHYDLNEPTERQKTKIMSYDEINTIRKTLEKGSLERLLLSFYTLMEPIRADYYATEIITDPTKESTEENYIILTPTQAQLVVRDFKTKHTYTKIENILPDELKQELIESLEKYPRNYVFVMDDKKTPFKRKLFSNWACRALTRVLKHGMTLTVLRHIYITNKIALKATPKELVDIAKKMGHTRVCQRTYEWV